MPCCRLSSARRCERDVVAPVGRREQLFLCVGSAHRNDVRIGGGIKRRRFRPGIACRGHHQNATARRCGDPPLDQRIFRAGKAHVDNLRTMLGRIVQSSQDHIGGALGAFGSCAECADRQQPRLRRATHQPGMGDDRTGNAGAVNMRTFAAAERVEVVGDRIGEFGMFGVDTGIDHRDGDVHAAGERMRLRQPKLGDGILRGVPLDRGLLLLLQEVSEIELHRPHAAVGCERAAHRVQRPPVDDAEQADGAAEQRKTLRGDALQAVAPRQIIGLGGG